MMKKNKVRVTIWMKMLTSRIFSLVKQKTVFEIKFGHGAQGPQ